MDMRHHSKILFFSAVLAFPCAHTAEAIDNDTLFISPDTLGNSFTLELSNAQLISETDSFTILIRRTSSSSDRKTYITFFSDRVVSNGETIARNLKDGNEMHNYRLARRGTHINIYRNNALFASTPNEETGEIPYSTSHSALPYEYSIIGITHLAEGFSADTLSSTTFTAPDEQLAETNIQNMLGGTNLVTDPYLNSGFTGTGLNASNRSFITNESLLGGWGTEAEAVSESYSGPYAIKLSGQAFNNGSATTGASLEIPAQLSANTNYLVRAMVKTDGYEGGIYCGTADSYIHIPDTKGEWKQIEGILTPTGALTALTIDNEDYENDGTLYIDNVEAYAEVSFTRLASYLPYASLPEGRISRYSYSGATAYMLEFILNGENSSQLDTTNLNYLGAARLTRAVEGSTLYPMYFPGEMKGVQITGSYDGYSFTNLTATMGLDYIIYRQNDGVFETFPIDEVVPAGCYLVQFVDNLADANVSIMTGRKETLETPQGNYNFVGNDTYQLYTPEGQFLRYDAQSGCFRLTEGESLEPFEAYIAPSVTNPVSVYYPSLTATGLQDISSGPESRMSVYSTQGGIVIYATQNGEIPIYRIDGTLVNTFSITEGENFCPLNVGIYIVKDKKVIVSQ